jgi:hypothetical protein
MWSSTTTHSDWSSTWPVWALVNMLLGLLGIACTTPLLLQGHQVTQAGGEGSPHLPTTSSMASRRRPGRGRSHVRAPLGTDVHFVQVLTDLLCVVAPSALYPNGGGCAIVLAGA